MAKALRNIAAHTLPSAVARHPTIAAVLPSMRLCHNAHGAEAPPAVAMGPRGDLAQQPAGDGDHVAGDGHDERGGISRADGGGSSRAVSSCTSSHGSQGASSRAVDPVAATHPDDGTLDERKLFVSNLSYDATAAEVGDVFGEHGTIANLFCPAPHKASALARRGAGARNRGFARITFEDVGAARAALSTLNGATIGGREVAVTVAKSRAWQRRHAALLKSRSKARAHGNGSVVLSNGGGDHGGSAASDDFLRGADSNGRHGRGLARRTGHKRRSRRPVSGDILRCGNDWQQAIEMLGLHSLDHDAAREAAQLVRQGGKSNRERALKLESYGRHCVDARRAGAALTVCANAVQWQPALALLERLRAQRDLGGADGPWCPDTYCYLQAIEACAAAGKWQRALEVLGQWSAERGPQISGMPKKVREKERDHASQCHAIAIGACGRAKQKEAAIKLLRQLPAPDKRAYDAALRACTFAGDVESALELIDEMRSSVHVGSPNILSYNSALIACDLTGNWRRATDVLQLMEADGRTDARNYLTAIRACGSGGSVDEEALRVAVETAKAMWQRLEFGSLPLASQHELIDIVKAEAGVLDEALGDQLSSELEQLLTDPGPASDGLHILADDGNAGTGTGTAGTAGTGTGTGDADTDDVHNVKK